MRKVLITIILVLAVFIYADSVQEYLVALIDPAHRYANGGIFNGGIFTGGSFVADSHQSNPDPVESKLTQSHVKRSGNPFYDWEDYFNYMVNDYALNDAESGGSTATNKDSISNRLAYLNHMLQAYSDHANGNNEMNIHQIAMWYLENGSDDGEEQDGYDFDSAGSLDGESAGGLNEDQGGGAGFADNGRVVVLGLDTTAKQPQQSEPDSGPTPPQAPTNVPEPATILLLGLGLVGVVFLNEIMKVEIWKAPCERKK